MNNLFDRRAIFLISILLLASILFLFLQPTLASVFNGTNRTDLITEFLSDSTTNGHIDGKKYWETREFYDPGSFEYNHDGFPSSKMNPILNNMEIGVINSNQQIFFLIFESSRWKSVEMLVNQQTIDAVIKNAGIGSMRTLLKKDTELIYHEDEQTLKIIFIKPISEMKQANGFFDYRGYDKEYLKEKYWMTISQVKL